MERTEVLVVGSGFAGSILARVLARQGRDVLLADRDRHPRFALGESSTPLGHLALERLARRYDLPDLDRLAAWGRWRRSLPWLGCGLKRGFTFYAHRRGEPYANGPDNPARLLVAASPDDEVADTHWLREDVDAHLAASAEAAGVDLRPQTELTTIEIGEAGVVARGEAEGRPLAVRADLVVDASGGAGFLAGRLPIPGAAGPLPATRLLYGHFDGVPDFAAVAREAGAALPPGPYPDDRAAVHHLLAEGWMYALGFDPPTGGERRRVSAGFVLGETAARFLPAAPEVAFRELLGRYPTLAAQLGDAQPRVGPAWVPRLAYRRARAAGRRWLLLPHAYAFFDPMFSTGIAWSLLAVERIAGELEGRPPGSVSWARYGDQLSREADQIGRLVEGAWLALGDFRLFTSWSFLYFVAASWAETRQRLRLGEGEPCWDGFLGVGDPVLAPLVAEALARLPAAVRGGRAEAFGRWLAEAIAPRNVAGLADPARSNLYPADLGTLVDRAALLGLSREKMRAALPRLAGSA